MSPLFTILISTFQTRELTRQCIQAVLDCSPLDKTQLIVTDDGSTDETYEMLADFPYDGRKVMFSVFRNEKNIGYPTSQNNALPHAEAPFIVTLNSDMIVCPGWLEKLHAPFCGPGNKVGVVGVKGTPCMLDADMGGHPGDRIDYVEGSCAMYSHSVILEAGGLYDPDFRRAYCEDADLSLRIRKAGYDLMLIDLPVKHIGQASTKVAIQEGQDIAGFEAHNRLLMKRKWPRFQRLSGDVRKILVIRDQAMGDVLLTTPVIAALKNKYPAADIDVETQYGDLFRGNRQVRATFQIHETSRDNYQFVIDLNGSYENSGKHIVDAYAETAGVELTDFMPRIYPSDDDRANAISQMSISSNKKWAALHCLGENVVGKTIPQDLQVKITQHLQNKGWFVVPLFKELTPSAGKLAAIIERCGLFVGADSGPSHIAQALEIPSVIIFGATSPDKIMVRDCSLFQGVTARPLEVGCLGCHHVDIFEHPGFRCHRTGNDYNRCMQKVHPEDVFAAIEKVLTVKKTYMPEKEAFVNGTRRLAVVYLAWEGAGPEPLRRFIESYKKHPAGQEHDLIILFKGYNGNHYRDARQLLAGVPHIAATVSDEGFDIQAYLKISKRIDHEFVCFLSSYTTIVSDDWLLKLYSVSRHSDVGIAGSMGSFAGASNAPGWPTLPNPHIRTTGFIIRRALLNSFEYQLGNLKMDCYQFESGSRGVTKRVLERGLLAVVVGADGKSYAIHEWPGSKTYGSRHGDNLLVTDRHIDHLNALSDADFEATAKIIWGKDAVR